jgi:hypothetical protein
MCTIFAVKYRTTVALINQYGTVPTFNIYFLLVGPGRVMRPCATRTRLYRLSNRQNRALCPFPPSPIAATLLLSSSQVIFSLSI